MVEMKSLQDEDHFIRQVVVGLFVNFEQFGGRSIEKKDNNDARNG